MAKIRDLIISKLKRFYFMMDTVEVDVLLLDQGLDGEATYSASDAEGVKRAMISIIPELLLMPDVSQGDFSVKRNVAGLKAYYALLCKDLGIEDSVNPPDEDYIVRDKSFLW